MDDNTRKACLKTAPNRPGVYQMYSKAGELLYVGKAKNLKNRLASYCQENIPNHKTRLLMAHVTSVETTITHSENEALLLENNLIKQAKPKYNVLLRDDKSYPYIFISTEAKFPRIDFHRGSKSAAGRYFGPFPSVSSVRETLQLLQRLFFIRQCKDSFFNNRTRPCLQYQIKRCSAPCVGYIDEVEYQHSIQHAILFLEGKNQEIINQLNQKMDHAVDELRFEDAAKYRDLLAKLRHVQEKQYIDSTDGDIDVIAVVTQKKYACVQVLTIRGGRMLGSKSFYPVCVIETPIEEVLSSFITQYYFNQSHNQDAPKEIIIEYAFDEQGWLESAISENCGHRIHFKHNVRGVRAKWQKMAHFNAQQALTKHLSERTTIEKQYKELALMLAIKQDIERVECFDISHTLGESTVASCVVFDIEGARKSDYRRFNISGITPGDDYAAIEKAVQKRYTRLKEHNKKLPDLIIIDGGKGQLSVACKVLAELQMSDVAIMGVAKGPERKAGRETLFLGPTAKPLQLAEDSIALHLIQRIRDEAHRFAITGHRQRRAKTRKESPLEQIPGIGTTRRQRLLKHFGGMQALEGASIDEIARVSGVSQSLAKRIYDVLHDD